MENKMESFHNLQRDLNSVQTHVTKLDEEVSTLKRTVRDFENNATALSNVFDYVRETSELNKSAVVSNNKQTEQCVKDLKSLEKELVAIRDSNDNLQSCVVDLKTRSMRDNLFFLDYLRTDTRIRSRSFRTSFRRNIR
jgi:chromosome segregation ATPase